MVIHMVKPIPMKESGPSRITIAPAMWGRNYAYAESSELLELADELKCRFSGPRAPATSTPMTPELAEEIREYAEANPGVPHQAIGEVFNVNHGRVSEAIKGKRT
jgi:hypothetical protein